MSLHKKNKPWWQSAVIYHIYPRSFFDSNGDGIGDLKGITQKIKYLKKLGVDAIWLSPVYPSPQYDFGYDVSNYQDIHNEFGSLNDFKELITVAHKSRIRVIMDMVLNHTSDQHPWFIESASTPDNPKRDWYLWRKGYFDKKPNNWKTIFGGSGWTFDDKTKEYYFHSCFKQQPDLNWRNQQVWSEFKKIMKFWLDMGVDGFRSM
jgi:alpha-glucosidase